MLTEVSFKSNVVAGPKHFVFGIAFVSLIVGAPQIGTAQIVSASAGRPDFAPAMIEHAQKMRRYKDFDRGVERIPHIIERFSVDRDPKGAIASFQPNGPTFTANNAFFKDMGTNGRSCFTCHRPENAWSVSADDVAERFEKSADDPYGCSTNPETGSGVLSMYRRPLPTTNIGFLSAIMWDGREPALESQAVAATLVHAQAKAAPTPEQVAQIVAFQKGIFTAQIFDNRAKFLTGDNARGGPVALSSQDFYIGINDPLGLNPKGIPFTPEIFDLYRSWLNAGQRHDHDGNGTPMANVNELFRTVNITDDWRHNNHERSMVNEHRRSVARGEELFNKTRINITAVSGLNDELKVDSIPGFCGTCHDSPNIGNHSVKAPLNIGVPDAGDKKPPALDISGLPVFTLKCTNVPDSDPLKNKVYKVTDPGRAMISGKCKDIGRFKGPILRGLAARAPYFHNGSAASLRDVVDFYDQRFGIGFTHKEKIDLVNFLNTL
jgi:cytochrome c peroxidase